VKTSNRNDQEREDELTRLQGETKRLRQALEGRQTELRAQIEEEIAAKLKAIGEEEASLRLYMQELRQAPHPGKFIRDSAENLMKEIEAMASPNKTDIEPTEEGKEEAKPVKVDKRKEERALDEKREQAEAAARDLREQIKHFDRLDRELSTKLEVMQSRRLAKRVAVYFGGVLIFIGGVLATAGLLLTLAGTEFPFLYSMFDVFFNILLILVGALMVISGFLHQT
jgi:seryl-tRNA synthetase